MAEQNLQEIVDREVQRQINRKVQQHNDYVAELQNVISEQKDKLIQQHNALTDLESEPLVFGELIKVHKWVDPSNFSSKDEITVIDPQSEHYQKSGYILKTTNDRCLVHLNDGSELQFAIGVEGGDPAQIRLIDKNDGTFAIVNVDGNRWQVKNIPQLDLQAGESVKIRSNSKAIVGRGCSFNFGPICRVNYCTEHGAEITHKGESHLVHNPNKFELETGDRVVCDSGMFCITDKLPPDNSERYNVNNDLNVRWSDVGGLDEAKQELKNAVELPFQKPELYKYYNINPLRGILLHGPPGCGKTLLARVCVGAIADIHGKEAADSGYLYVKSPELLDKWVGNTEAEIRSLFERSRRHYYKHGYKAVLVFDEADAIMPQRGSRRSSDIADTIVPMFLGEMDGIDKNETEANPIVFLLTNRSDIIDPAITRPGRIDQHIKINRPDEITAVDVLKIHTQNVPFEENSDPSTILTITSADIFSKSRILYRINNELDFTLGDAINSATLASVAEIAKMQALHRDLAGNTQTGVCLKDFQESVEKIFKQQQGVNHSFDLQDFGDRHGLQSQNMQVDRCFGAS